MKISSFTKKESYQILLILMVVLVATLANLRVSYRKSRDAQRKQDLRQFSDIAGKYYEDYEHFPFAKDGKIMVCNRHIDDKRATIFEPCSAGQDGSPYTKMIPADPKNSDGYKYLYVSNGKQFQIYGALEGKSEDEYNEIVESLGLDCGVKKCNFGLASDNTPLEKPVNEITNPYDYNILNTDGN